ncbi:ferredoxin [Halorutilales archaeon Cl-col2-1]
MRKRTQEVVDEGFTDHVLVCTNSRDSNYASCSEVGGEEVYDEVVDWLKQRGVFWSNVYVGTVSCIGLCSTDGVAVAIQPRNEWYSDVKPDDVPDLMSEEFGDDADALGETP